MTDPFSAWTRLASAVFDMQKTWLRSIETLQASHAGIAPRTAKLRDVASNPLTDHAEFARMVPEKVEAFGRSAEAVAKQTMALHSAWIGQMQRVGAVMLTGRLPSMAEAATLAGQSAHYTLGAVAAGSRLGAGAIAPVHRTATGNARRLGRGQAR